MKISILINPQEPNSMAINHAFNFIQTSLDKNINIDQVYFYGYAVEFAYSQGLDSHCWQKLAKNGLKLLACSAIAETYKSKNMDLNQAFVLAGLGQWMESILSSDKYIEFS
jgi:sulfur relay (sulfurtransferase) complex TusBCD TusD component (DsrE family)